MAQGQGPAEMALTQPSPAPGQCSIFPGGAKMSESIRACLIKKIVCGKLSVMLYSFFGRIHDCAVDGCSKSSMSASI